MYRFPALISFCILSFVGDSPNKGSFPFLSLPHAAPTTAEALLTFQREQFYIKVLFLRSRIPLVDSSSKIFSLLLLHVRFILRLAISFSLLNTLLFSCACLRAPPAPPPPSLWQSEWREVADVNSRAHVAPHTNQPLFTVISIIKEHPSAFEKTQLGEIAATHVTPAQISDSIAQALL